MAWLGAPKGRKWGKEEEEEAWVQEEAGARGNLPLCRAR